MCLLGGGRVSVSATVTCVNCLARSMTRRLVSCLMFRTAADIVNNDNHSTTTHHHIHIHASVTNSHTHTYTSIKSGERLSQGTDSPSPLSAPPLPVSATCMDIVSPSPRVPAARGCRRIPRVSCRCWWVQRATAVVVVAVVVTR